MLVANGINVGIDSLLGGKPDFGVRLVLNGTKQCPATKLDPFTHGSSSQAKCKAHSSHTGSASSAPKQNHAKDTNSINLPWATFLGALFDFLVKPVA